MALGTISSSYLSKNRVKDIDVGGEIDARWSVVGQFLVGFSLIVENVQLHSQIRCVAFPARIIVTFLIRVHFKPLRSCSLYFRLARHTCFLENFYFSILALSLFHDFPASLFVLPIVLTSYLV